MAVAVGIWVGLLWSGVQGENLHDWQSLGRAGGVEAWSTQTPDGTVRILFRNGNPHAVSIQVARTIIWCGSDEKGTGEALDADIGSFQLQPAESRSSPRWSRTCRKPDYYVEFRGISIESHQ
ncbi:MAG: hypothetical protein U5K33_10110 [Halofilum sp. (in: g-proteobacteria)]|nr:hypothetical protein [Halofilum sp. (in: g-proteobacteria)]